MRFLKQNTATVITVGPFLDKTDGVTPETALTVTSCHLTLMVDNAGTPTLALDANATASGGNNDMVHVTNDDAGFYTLELTAANLNYLGGAILAITDAATHVPVFHEFDILPANVYDSLIGGTDYLQADTIQIEGSDATSQINAEVLDVFNVDTQTEISSIPAASATIFDMIKLLFALARNKMTVTSSTQTLRNDGDTGSIGSAAVDMTGGTFTRDEWT